MVVFILNKNNNCIITPRQLQDSWFQMWQRLHYIACLYPWGKNTITFKNTINVCNLHKFCVRHVENMSHCLLQDYCLKMFKVHQLLLKEMKQQGGLLYMHSLWSGNRDTLHQSVIWNSWPRKRPQQFIYSSFKIGTTHANKAVWRAEGTGGCLGRYMVQITHRL